MATHPLKPLITGLDDPPDPRWPPDHELLARVSGRSAAEIIRVGYGPPVSPHLAAELAEVQPPSVASLSAWVRSVSAPGEVTVVEGVGGLLAPLGPDSDVGDLAVDLGLPVVIAARPGLGTINHTLLTVEAARSRGLEIAGVVLTPWPRQPGALEESNAKTIARRGAVSVARLGFVAAPEPESLAAAADELPLKRWLRATIPRKG